MNKAQLKEKKKEIRDNNDLEERRKKAHEMRRPCSVHHLPSPMRSAMLRKSL